MDLFEHRAQELVDAGRELYAMGMVPATSGNFSARLEDGTVAITVSGGHKGKLDVGDIMRISSEGKSLDGRRPSAETLLHVGIYQRFPKARVVLHPHSVSATLLSRLAGDAVVLAAYELLKAFPGIETHDTQLTVPVFDNDQDIGRLAALVDTYFETNDSVHGYLIRGHGFYTWGHDISSAMRHVEAFNFLFDCELRLRGIPS